jgi:acyl transferase domain-containing protein
MAKELYEEEPVFREYMLGIDRHAQELTGVSLIDLLYFQGKDNSEVFDETRYTSPAIFMTQYALAKTLMAKGIQPKILITVSLGIFAAGCIAGAISLDEALTAVIQKSRIFEEVCPRGAMVAILDNVRLYESEVILNRYSDLAGVSSGNHFVIATSEENLPAICSFLSQSNTAFQRLPVSHAFHSRWIDQAKSPCIELFRKMAITPTKIPILCSSRQTFIYDITPEGLWDVLRNPIQFSNTIKSLKSPHAYSFIDIGPGSTAATLLKHNINRKSWADVNGILSPYPGEFKRFKGVLEKFS